MGNYDIGAVNFRQSACDFPLTVALDRKTPSFGLHRFKQGLRFVPPGDEGFTLRGDNRRLLYKGRRVSHRFTILGDTSFEYDCILLREPESNVVSLQIEGGEHFDFFKQPDFVDEPFLRGSYAVYKKETLLGEGTGKLCHIHRPLIIDALGRRVWGDLSIAGNVLRITIPEQWLAGAKYPVVVDPTIGTETVGSQYKVDGENFYLDCQIALNRFLVPEVINGVCTAYFYTNQDDTDAAGRPVLYSDNGNKPLTRKSSNETLADLRVTSGKPKGWRSASCKSNGSIASGSYIWFGLYVEYMWYPRFDYGFKCMTGFWQDEGVIPSAYPANYLDTYENYKLSMYFTYTPPQNYTRTLTQGVKLNDSGKIIAAYQKTFKHTVNGSGDVLRFETFFRQCFSSVANSVLVDKSVGILRTIVQEIDVSSVFFESREIVKNIIETVQAGSFFQRVQGLWRDVRDTAAGGETLQYPVLFSRSISDIPSINDIFNKRGDFYRGLYDSGDTAGETEHRGEYYRNEHDTVQAEGQALRGLIFFVRIFTHVFIRDYLLGRFLTAREELKLKSCITREITLDSRID